MQISRQLERDFTAFRKKNLQAEAIVSSAET